MMSYFNSGVHKFLILLKLSTFVMLVKHFLLSVCFPHIYFTRAVGPGILTAPLLTHFSILCLYFDIF